MTTPFDHDTLSQHLDAAGLDRDLLTQRLHAVLAAPPTSPPNAWLDLFPEVDADHPLTPHLVAWHHHLTTAPPTTPTRPLHARLDALRQRCRDLGLTALLIPHSDRYQGEYLPARAERLAWATGFTGSAGAALILLDRAVLFVDGRYTLQASQQVHPDHFALEAFHRDAIASWLDDHLQPNDVLGIDPWLHTVKSHRQLHNAVQRARATLKHLDTNPVDALWDDQPPPPLSAIRPHPLEFSGRSADDKRQDVAAMLTSAHADALILNTPDSIAWLLNIRGGDVPFTPLPLCMAIVHRDARVELFTDPRKILPDTRQHLGDHVDIYPPEHLGQRLDALDSAMLDPASTAAWIQQRLASRDTPVQHHTDPCQLPKATKNTVEIEGSRLAHRIDGVAITRFLHWLDEVADLDTLTELDAAAQLDRFRADDPRFVMPSFPSISGVGPNGAIVHYRVTPESSRCFKDESVFLIDSGGQYREGTTDITRTVAIGPVDDDMRACFTRVLRGHIALSTARFPHGTRGDQLDVLARQPLWEAGLNFNHGTGHGVGSFLSVHEGPQRISTVATTVPLKPGMILSNEPGYYRANAFGIRIENLVLVIDDPRDAEQPMRCFEPLTLAPIDQRLIDLRLLPEAHQRWLDDYHARVRETLLPHLDDDVAAWLRRATAPLHA